MTCCRTPTRRSVPRRIVDALRRAYLRAWITECERQGALHEWHAEREPALAEAARTKAAELRVQLAALE